MSVVVECTVEEAKAMLAGPNGCRTLEQQRAFVGGRQKLEQAVRVETGPGGSEFVGENPPPPAQQTDRAAA